MAAHFAFRFAIITFSFYHTKVFSRSQPVSSDAGFKKVPLLGESLKVYETGFQERSMVTCALACKERRASSPVCQAVWFDPQHKTCQFFKKSDGNVIRESSQKVFQVQDTDRFHGITVGDQKVSIYLSSTRKTYLEARRGCQEVGGYLFEFASLAEYEAVDLVLKGQTQDLFWMGVNDLETEGHWVTDKDNETLDTTLWQWFDRNPDNYNGQEHCGVYIRSLSQLGDVTCDRREHYLCKRET